MEAKTEECRKQEFGTDRPHSSAPWRHYPPLEKSRNSRRASQTQASRRKFCSSRLASRNTRKCMKIKTRCHSYPSQNRGGYFAVFGPFQTWF